MKRLIAVAALVLPGIAAATGERVVILAPTGAPGVQAQLRETVCVSEECVAPEQVLSAGKLDWNKVSRENVASVVVGHAIANKKGPEIELSVLAPGGKVKRTEKVALNDENKLAVKDLVTASAIALDGIDSDGPAKEGPKSAKASKAAVAHRGHLKAGHRFASRPHVAHAHG